VQTFYRGLLKISLGKCRNPARGKPGKPSCEVRIAYTVIFDSVWEDVTAINCSLTIQYSN